MCIKLHKTAGVTQLQATASCRNESAKLVRIDSDKKTNFILSWIFSHGGKYGKNTKKMSTCNNYHDRPIIERFGFSNTVDSRYLDFGYLE